MCAQPGKKLLFMGSEFGQWREWNHDGSLDWHLLDAQDGQHPAHRGVALMVGELNRLYRSEKSLHELDLEPGGFSWVDANDGEHSVLVYRRHARDGDDSMLIALNFTPVVLRNYRVGVPRGGQWQEVFNSDAPSFWGSGQGNLGGVQAVPVTWHGQPWSVNLTIPPLGAVYLKPPR